VRAIGGNQVKLLIAFFSTIALTSVGHAAEPFGTMICKKVISDEMYLATKAERLSVKWVTRGGKDVVKLLRALADEKIPTSLLSAYGDLKVQFSIPLDSCKFTGTGKFSCSHAAKSGKNIALKIEAKVSPYDYDVEPEVYEGELSKVSIQSKFYGKKDARYLEFPMQFEVESPDAATVKAKSEFFFAHHWDYDGFGQNPSCLVDSVYLVD